MCNDHKSLTRRSRTKTAKIKKADIKEKEVDLYSAFIVVPYTQSAQVLITQFYLQSTPYCLYLISVHQMAPPQTEVADI